MVCVGSVSLVRTFSRTDNDRPDLRSLPSLIDQPRVAVRNRLIWNVYGSICIQLGFSRQSYIDSFGLGSLIQQQKIIPHNLHRLLPALARTSSIPEFLSILMNYPDRYEIRKKSQESCPKQITDKMSILDTISK